MSSVSLRHRSNDTKEKGTRNITNARTETLTTPKSKIASIGTDLDTATGAATHRLWTRAVIATSVMIVVYFYSQQHKIKETKFALANEKLPLRIQKFECSESYKTEIRRYPNCLPKNCGRFVSDQLVEENEVDILLNLVRTIFAITSSSGGASILNLNTGALSYKEQFVNAYRVPKVVAEIREHHLAVYNAVKNKIKHAIADQFGISIDSLYLTDPTFFSQLTNATARTMNDEYWHKHVDKETYESFHYTSLLYLNTYERDYKGGRFIFTDDSTDANVTNSIVEPKKGRVSAFTSGAENPHYVEQVTDGERYAITISFTCDRERAISDLLIKKPNL